MDVRIATLTENTATCGYLGEWGLSVLVEADGAGILVDTGLSFSAVHNALMGVDLSAIERVVLSHGQLISIDGDAGLVTIEEASPGG